MNNKEFLQALKSLPEPDEMLRIIIEDYQLSRREICKRTGVSNGYISHLLHQQRVPTYKPYCKLISVFCDPLEEL